MDTKKTIKNVISLFTEITPMLLRRYGMSKTDFLSLKGTLKTSSNFGILEALTAVKYTCDNFYLHHGIKYF